MRAQILSSLLLVAGCATDRPVPMASTPEARYGEALSDLAATAIDAVLAAPRDYDGKNVKVRGRVSAVCQKKGCWMTLASPGRRDHDRRVRVTFRGYSFFVPKDLAGKTAVVEGVFSVKTVPRAEAQHYADDEAQPGQPARSITGDQTELSLVASGVEVWP